MTNFLNIFFFYKFVPFLTKFNKNFTVWWKLFAHLMVIDWNKKRTLSFLIPIYQNVAYAELCRCEGIFLYIEYIYLLF